MLSVGCCFLIFIPFYILFVLSLIKLLFHSFCLSFYYQSQIQLKRISPISVEWNCTSFKKPVHNKSNTGSLIKYQTCFHINVTFLQKFYDCPVCNFYTEILYSEYFKCERDMRLFSSAEMATKCTKHISIMCVWLYCTYVVMLQRFIQIDTKCR